MHRLLLASALALVLVACGGKSKSTADPTATTCCCTSGDAGFAGGSIAEPSLRSGGEIVAETVCTERGGACEPAETCEATDPSIDNDGGGSDPDEY